MSRAAPEFERLNSTTKYVDSVQRLAASLYYCTLLLKYSESTLIVQSYKRTVSSRAAPQRIKMGGGNRQIKGCSQKSSYSDQVRERAKEKAADAKRKADADDSSDSSSTAGVENRPKSMIIFVCWFV